jgi:hypothetical protein
MNDLPLESDRVRRHTSPEVNDRIDRQIAATVHRYVGQPVSAITERIEEIEREWDMERTLETNASALSLMGVSLAAMFSKRWLALPGTVLSFLLLHAIQGWCPPVPLFRRMGVRTRSEIERERFALKFLRGDFNDVIRDGPQAAPEQLLAALRR